MRVHTWGGGSIHPYPSLTRTRRTRAARGITGAAGAGGNRCGCGCTRTRLLPWLRLTTETLLGSEGTLAAAVDGTRAGERVGDKRESTSASIGSFSVDGKNFSIESAATANTPYKGALITSLLAKALGNRQNGCMRGCVRTGKSQWHGTSARTWAAFLPACLGDAWWRVRVQPRGVFSQRCRHSALAGTLIRWVEYFNT